MSLWGACTGGGDGATSTSNSRVLTLPPGCQPGMVCLVETTININGSTASIPGFSVVSGPDSPLSGHVNWLLSKVLTAADISAGSFTVSWGGSTGRCMAVGTVRTGVSGAPVVAYAGASSTISLDAPTVQAPADGSDVFTLAFSRIGSGKPVSASYPQGWTQGVQTATNMSSGVNWGGSTATKDVVGAAGTYGGETISFAGTATSASAYTVALAPSAPPTYTTATAVPVIARQTASASTEGTTRAALAGVLAIAAAATTVGVTAAQAPAQVAPQVSASTEAAVAVAAPVVAALQVSGATTGEQAVTLPAVAALGASGATVGESSAALGVQAALEAAGATEGRAVVAAPLAAGLRLFAQTVVTGTAAAPAPLQVDPEPTATTEGAAAITLPAAVRISLAPSTVGTAATSLPATVVIDLAAATEDRAAVATLPLAITPGLNATTEGQAAVAVPLSVRLVPAVPGAAPVTPTVRARLTRGLPHVATLTGEPAAGTLSGAAHTPTISEGDAVLEFTRTDRKPIMWDAVVMGADPTDAVATLVIDGDSHPMRLDTVTRTPGGWTVRATSVGLFAGPDAAGAGATPLITGAQPAVFTLTIGDTVLTDPDTITVT